MIRDIRIMPAVRAAGRGMEELLFPRRCPFCDRPVSAAPEEMFHALACPSCEGAVQKLSPVRDVLCLRCGRPMENETQEYCGDCRRGGHVFSRGCAVYRYRDVSGTIYRFKYNGRAEYADYLGEQMAQRFLEEFDPGLADALVPVPLSAERQRSRGWNQAALLAEVIGKRTGVPVREDLLVRKESTQAMRGVGAQERRRRLKNAFLFTGDDVKSKKYVLVDDIYTTGATIDACSRELLRAGAGGIFFITLAIGTAESSSRTGKGYD